MPNPCGKTRPKDQPYEVWLQPNGWRHHVLKKYQSPEGEAKNPFAVWLCFVDGGDSFPETGDTYKAEVTKYGRLIEVDGEPV